MSAQDLLTLRTSTKSMNILQRLVKIGDFPERQMKHGFVMRKEFCCHCNKFLSYINFSVKNGIIDHRLFHSVVTQAQRWKAVNAL